MSDLVVSDLYVLTTFYKVPLTGKVIMHAYGPWPRTTCERERRRTLAEHAAESLRGELHVSVCKVMDVKS